MISSFSIHMYINVFLCIHTHTYFYTYVSCVYISQNFSGRCTRIIFSDTHTHTLSLSLSLFLSLFEHLFYILPIHTNIWRYIWRTYEYAEVSTHLIIVNVLTVRVTNSNGEFKFKKCLRHSLFLSLSSESFCEKL